MWQKGFAAIAPPFASRPADYGEFRLTSRLKIVTRTTIRTRRGPKSRRMPVSRTGGKMHDDPEIDETPDQRYCHSGVTSPSSVRGTQA
jgi:hypothetical protein